MARARDLRLWGLAVFAACLLAGGAGVAGRSAEAAPEGAPSRPVTAVMSATVDAAVLPARVVDEIRGTGSAGPPRLVVLGAVLSSLFGLPALLRRTSPDIGRGRAPLHARRHSIALRAPPLRFRPI